MAYVSSSPARPSGRPFAPRDFPLAGRPERSTKAPLGVTKPARFEDEADAEYRAAGRRYEERVMDLGIEFFDAVDATLRVCVDRVSRQGRT